MKKKNKEQMDFNLNFLESCFNSYADGFFRRITWKVTPFIRPIDKFEYTKMVLLRFGDKQYACKLTLPDSELPARRNERDMYKTMCLLEKKLKCGTKELLLLALKEVTHDPKK